MKIFIAIIIVFSLAFYIIPDYLVGHFNPYAKGTGHHAGWEYAAKECDGVSDSFIEGCEKQNEAVREYWCFVAFISAAGGFLLGRFRREKDEMDR
ncbi:MAG: hypothetical protein WC497_05955 [Patescibacteria group bacterium]